MTKQKDFFVLVNKCLYREVNLTKHNAIEKPNGGNSTQVDNRTGVFSLDVGVSFVLTVFARALFHLVLIFNKQRKRKRHMLLSL